MWVQACTQLSVALKFDAGQMGLRIVLDPEKLISADTTAVIKYMTAQLTKHYPNLTSVPSKWKGVRNELSKTIKSANMTYTKQAQQIVTKKISQ